MAFFPKYATKTLEAIENALVKDQGAKFRESLGQVISLCTDAYNPKQESFRSHLGASLIGRKCTRELWYSFRWSLSTQHQGRMVRLFNRGHLEEARFVALLMTIGCTIWQFDQNGKQWKISDVYGHFGGSLDGVVTGIPDIPIGEACLTEFKTHSEKSFIKLQSSGVQEAKFEHYVQMQIYMLKMNLKYALYMAVNKNNDELYAEIIDFNHDVANAHIKRAYFIVNEVDAPRKLSSNPSWHECKFCDYKSICHGKDIPSINCRTCQNAIPLTDGSKNWYCVHNKTSLDSVMQIKGCDQYRVNDNIKKAI